MTDSGSTKKLQVFISHADEDNPAARRLYKRLKEDGFDPWLDEERLLPGQDWRLECEKAMRASDAILVFFSEESVSKSGFVQKEFKRALEIQEEKPEGAIFVIPVRLDKSEVPFSFRDLHWVDYPADYDRLLLSLQQKSGGTAMPVKTTKPKTPAPRTSARGSTGKPKTAKPDGGHKYDVKGGIHAGQNVVIGNQVNYYADLSRVEKIFEEIKSLFRDSQTRVEVGGDMRESVLIQGSHNNVQISRGDIDLLGTLQSRAESTRREEIYLTRLLLSELHAPWEHLYVPLSGKMDVREVLNHLPVKYFELVVSEGGDGQATPRSLSDITQAMESHSAFIILGDPGAGKTTTQQKIAFDAARKLLEGKSGHTPLFVSLSEQREQDPYGFLQTEWERRVGTPFKDALDNGRILFLLDGVNELPRENRTGRLKAWRVFYQNYHGKNQFIFSGRRLDYESGLDLPRVFVDHLEKEQIIEFLKRHQAEGLADLLEDASSRLMEMADNPLNLLILTIAYKRNPNQKFENRGELFQNFTKDLFVLENREHSVGMPIDAMKLALSQMAFTMQEQGEGLTFENETARKAVPETVNVKGEAIHIDASRLFTFGRGATVLDPTKNPDVKFRHHVLQEYFASLELLRRFSANEDLSRLWRVKRAQDEMPPANIGEWDALIDPPPTGWEVTTILACGLSNDPAKLIEAVRVHNPALAGRCLDEAGISLPLLSGEGRGEVGVRARVQADLLSDLYNPVLHLRARLQAGFVLGRIGDPRFEPKEINGVKVILPQMANVPGGKYLIGSKEKEEDSFDNEHPQFTVDLPAFSISKWSVTNAEFACFMEAGGYENENYWEGEMAKRWLKGENVTGDQFKTWLDNWKWFQEHPNWKEQFEQSGNYSPQEIEAYEEVAKMSEDELKAELGKSLSQKSRSQPAYWKDRENNNPSQPVVGITWFEARAYCKWLSTIAGRNYRLPSEVEWEAAARGLPDKSLLGQKNARKYPWGNDWDKEKANSIEGRVLKPSPVGAYSAAGALGPFGAEDQAGNVYDWTSSLYLPYPYHAEKSEQEEADGERTVRGGSWHNFRRNVRCASRSRNVPDNCAAAIGFRLVSPGSDSSAS